MNQSATLTPSVNLIGSNNTGLAEASTKTSAGATTPTRVPAYYSTSTGSVSGRVTTSSNDGAGGASVYIVDANDLSHILYRTTADSGGYYQFSNVNTTGGQPAYAIFAKHNYLGYGYSYPFMVSQYTVVVNVMVSTTPISSPNPSTIPTGSVTGKVTTQNTTIAIGGAFVAILGSHNTSNILYTGVADSNGYYQFTGIPPTSGTSEYVMYANASGYGEGMSHSFSVTAGTTAITSVVIFTMPTNIVMSGNNTIHADGSSVTTINAYVTDFKGNPVGDGTAITFSLSDTSAGNGIVAPMTANTKNGIASSYWGSATKTGTNTIIAASANNPNLKSSMTVYVIP